MNRLIAALSALSALTMVGCAASDPDSLGSELRGRELCMTSSDCARTEYCTIEDGDCFSNCPPGENCPTVCWGVCAPRDGEYCHSSRDCGEGEYCSVDDGDCFSNCPPGQLCRDVCGGYCKPKAEYCYSSANCDEGEHCSVEDGDCFSNCPPGMVCPAVCQGMCVRDDAGAELSSAAEPAIHERIRPRQRCYSSANCERGEYCTVEDGDCNSDCAPGMVCPAVCSGFCAPIRDDRERCGDTVCGEGMVCCNASCGICTPPGWACTQQACI